MNPGDESKTDFSLDPLSLIEKDIGDERLTLYVGDCQGASNIEVLREHNITIVVNCTVNLDINYVLEPKGVENPGKCGYGMGPIRCYKAGLIDGPGNPDSMMLAAYLILNGALHQVIPEKATYPQLGIGNILVHCRGGRSRSTALAALFLHLNVPERFPDLDIAIDHVRVKRGIHPDEWFKAPKPILIEATRKAATMVRTLGSAGIYDELS